LGPAAPLRDRGRIPADPAAPRRRAILCRSHAAAGEAVQGSPAGALSGEARQLTSALLANEEHQHVPLAPALEQAVAGGGAEMREVLVGPKVGRLDAQEAAARQGLQGLARAQHRQRAFHALGIEESGFGHRAVRLAKPRSTARAVRSSGGGRQGLTKRRFLHHMCRRRRRTSWASWADWEGGSRRRPWWATPSPPAPATCAPAGAASRFI